MKKILVALDGSSREIGTLDAAIALGRKTGAKLLLFRSVGIPHAHDLPADFYAMDPQELPKILQERALLDLAKLEPLVPLQCRGGMHVVVGTPWQSITRVAQEEDVDLILVGSHGYDVMDRLLGTTAAKVVNHADRSVLVVRAPERFTSE